MKKVRLLYFLLLCVMLPLAINVAYSQEADYLVLDVLYAKGSKLKHISHVKSIQSKIGGIIITQYEYDEQGRISKVSRPMYEDGTPMFENGTIVGLVSYSDYVYNNEDLLEKIIYYHSNIYEGFINLQTNTYSYDKDGNKIKEVIEYPRAAPFQTDSTLYHYDNNRLLREDKYEDGYFGSEPWRSELITYIEYEYDNQGQLIKETNYSGMDNTLIQFSVHSYQNGLNVKTENFCNDQKIREIRRYYDKNDNLIYLESKELSMYSSTMSCVTMYEYYVPYESENNIIKVNNQRIQILPNPTEGIIEITGIEDYSSLNYAVYNSIGQIIQNGNLKRTIDLSSRKGLIILTIMQNQQVIAREKVIIK